METIEETMIVKTPSWVLDQNGKWELYFNNAEMTAKKEETEEIEVEKLEGMKRSDDLVLGTLVMTPDGIGRLVKTDEATSTVKFIQSEKQTNYRTNEVANFFKVLIKCVDSKSQQWLSFKVPANGSVDLLKALISTALESQISSFTLIYNGVEMEDDKFFDQLNIKSCATILMYKMNEKAGMLDRFTTSYTYWYSYANDGLGFSTDKNCKLTGIALWGSHESKIQNLTVKVLEGTWQNHSILFEDTVMVPAAPNQNDSKMPTMFKKKIRIKANTKYIIHTMAKDYCYMYYGGGGKKIIEENGVTWTFEHVAGSPFGTSGDTGNIPRIYFAV